MKAKKLKKPKIEVGNNISELLKQKSLTQLDLHNKSKIDNTQLNKYIRNKVECKIGKALRISKALGRPVEDVFYLRKAS